MPSGPFAHVCLLVENLERAIEDWTRILGVLDPGQLGEPLVRYEDFAGGADSGMRWATFVSRHGCEIQFIQPAPDTPLGRRLAKLGEHVHHLCFTTPDVPGALDKLAAQGIERASGGQVFSDPGMPWQRWGWVSARSAHGVLLEVASPYESRQDGRWHPVANNEPGN
jgi:methylmalonyl-CoA/ethylmalonyl-CoA epimerase